MQRGARVSYASRESSTAQGAPIELYEFRQGVLRWTYCSAADPVTHAGMVFEPAAIERDRVKQTTDPFKNDLRVTLPRAMEFAARCLGTVGEDVTTLTIYRGHVGDGEFIAYWKGRLVGAEASGNTVVLECESVFTSIRRPGLRARFEYGCRHPLYSPQCAVFASAYETDGTVASMDASGLAIVSAAAAAQPEGHFSGGILAAGGVRRFIVTHGAGGALTLSRVVPGLLTGAAIKLYPGCDHTRAACADKFANLDNFGGFPWIPTRNPFDGGSLF